MSDQQQSGLTRRDMLKRGAIFGGAVIWATPTVQTVSMFRSAAQAASPQCWMIKVGRVTDTGTALFCEPVGGANVCLEANYPDGCDYFASGTTEPENGSVIFRVKFTAACAGIEIKETCGVSGNTEVSVTWAYDEENDEYVFTAATGSQDLSHLEIAFCCN